MVIKKKVTKTTVSKKTVKANKKVNNESEENKSLEEFIDNAPLEEDLKEIPVMHAIINERAFLVRRFSIQPYRRFEQ